MVTENELYEWAEQQKKDYRLGRLTREQIDKLQSLPGWTWNETKED